MPRKINLIVIHCAETPNGREQTVKDIDSWHRERGFQRTLPVKDVFNPNLTSIGYHFVIYIDGTVHTGRAIDEPGAHVAGFNSRSLGICMIGKDKFTPAQWAALHALLAKLTADIKFSGRICGHRDLSPDKNHDGKITADEYMKTCPGFEVAVWLQRGMVAEPVHLLEVTA